MSQPLAQPPKNEERTFNDWMLRLWKRLTAAGGLPWSVVDKTGSNLTDIETRHHDDLQYIPADPVIYSECDHEETPFIPPPQSYDFEQVIFPAKYSLGPMAHVYTLQELMNHEWSAGVVDGATITDNGNGTISLSAATAVLRATTDPHLTLYGVKTDAQLNIALTDNATNYVYIDWNAGSPTFNVSTSVTSFNCLDKCIAYVVHRSGNILHWIDAREQNVDFNRKYRQFSLKIERFRHANDGTVLGSSGLAITLTAGTFYFMVQQIDHIAFDTTVAGTANANVFTLWYRNGVGGWTETANQKTVTTTTYDGNTGTPVTLGNNKFGVTWFYVINDSPSELHAVMGQAEYANLASAEAASPPSSTPTIVSGMGSLVGFVVYEKGNTVFDNVLSTFSQSFTASAATTHNGLAGIQGGTTNEYYHLTAAQSQQVNDFINRGAIGIPGMDGEDGEMGFPIPGPKGDTGASGSGGGAVVLISSQTASSSSSIDFTSISNSTYNSYILICDRVIPATDATTLQLQVSKGGTWDTTVGNYTHNNFRYTAVATGVDGSIGDSSAALSGTVETLGTGVHESFSGTFELSNCLQTSADMHWYGQYSMISAAPFKIVGVNGGAIDASSARDGFRIKMSSGNIASGTFKLYGVT